jgi:hypothetical protein
MLRIDMADLCSINIDTINLLLCNFLMTVRLIALPILLDIELAIYEGSNA